MLRHREHDISYQKQVTGQSHNFVVLKNKQNKKKTVTGNPPKNGKLQ